MFGDTRLQGWLDGWEAGDEDGKEEAEALLPRLFTGGDVADRIRRVLGDYTFTEARWRNHSDLRRLGVHIDVEAATEAMDRTLTHIGLPVTEEPADGPGAIVFIELARLLKAKGLRLKGKSTYRPIEGEDGSATNAFEQGVPVRTFVYNEASRPGQQLFNLSLNKAVLPSIIVRLENLTESDVIDMYEPDPTLHAFTDGCYDVETRVLTPHADMKRAASVYHPTTFFAAGTPLFNQMFADQQVPECARDVFLALTFGRMLLPIDDGLQICVVLKGLPGTGKSVLVDVLTQMLGYGAVATLSSSCTPRWMGAQLLEKRMYVCTDLDDRCQWPKSFFLSITGDTVMEVERKFEQPRTMACNHHGIIATNVKLPWHDVAGEVRRRVVPFAFNVPVGRSNPDLKAGLLQELPALMEKGLRRYDNLISMCRTATDIINMSPIYMRMSQLDLLQ